MTSLAASGGAQPSAVDGERVAPIDTTSAWWWSAGLVAAVAFAARLVPVLRGGGLRGIGNYDDGVYYAAAAGFSQGLMPYRDFLLLHPPGIVLVLWPFAMAGHLIGDPNAMALARVAFMLLGALNAVLISRILRPSGLAAAAVGGLAYAVFFPAVYIGHTTLLETPATTCLLHTMLILGSVPATGAHRWVLSAGVFVGASAGIKIWGVVMAAAIVVWVAATLGLRRALTAFLGVLIGATVVCLPFYLVAPSQMWEMVVSDQLGRAEMSVGAVPRAADILGLSALPITHGATAGLVVAITALVACCVLACRGRVGRLGALTLVAGCVLLLFTPSWFPHYAGLTGAPVALVVGAAAGEIQRWLDNSLRTLVVVGLLIAGLAIYSLPVFASTFGEPFPAAKLRASAVAVKGCVTSDDPIALIELNVLRRNLLRGCPLTVDLGGYSYYLRPVSGSPVIRQQNAAWQRHVIAYLRSGDAAIVMRFRRRFGLSPKSATIVGRWPVRARAGRFTLRTTRPNPA